MYLFTNDPELIRMGRDYLRIAGISYLFLGVSQISMTLMKNCGAVGMSTFLSMVAVILNIILNAIFIFGLCGSPRMGIQGAALATVIATVIQATWSFGYVVLKRKQVRFLKVRVNRELWKGFREKTAPVLFNELAWGGGFTMYSVILGHMGSDAVAANGIANIPKNSDHLFCSGTRKCGKHCCGNLWSEPTGRSKRSRKNGYHFLYRQRDHFRRASDCSFSTDRPCNRTVSAGAGLSAENAADLFLLSGGKIGQLYDDRRYLYSGRRYEVWYDMRHRDPLVRDGSAGCTVCVYF